MIVSVLSAKDDSDREYRQRMATAGAWGFAEALSWVPLVPLLGLNATDSTLQDVLTGRGALSVRLFFAFVGIYWICALGGYLVTMVPDDLASRPARLLVVDIVSWAVNISWLASIIAMAGAIGFGPRVLVKGVANVWREGDERCYP